MTYFISVLHLEYKLANDLGLTREDGRESDGGRDPTVGGKSDERGGGGARASFVEPSVDPPLYTAVY
jgi:hypothetical protein